MRSSSARGPLLIDMIMKSKNMKKKEKKKKKSLVMMRMMTM